MRLIADTSPLSNPSQFGPDISDFAQGISVLGRGLGMANQNSQNQQDMNERVWASAELSRFKRSMTERFAVNGEAYEPGEFNDLYATEMAAIIDRAPSAKAKASLEIALNEFAPSAMAYNVRSLAEKNLKQSQTNAIGASQELIAEAGMTGNFQGSREQIKSLRAATGNRLGVTVTSALDKALTNLDLDEIDAFSKKYSPGQAASALRAGKIAPEMDDIARSSLAVKLDAEESALAEFDFVRKRQTVAALSEAASSGSIQAAGDLKFANDALELSRLRFEETNKSRAERDESLLAKLPSVLEKWKAAKLPESNISQLREQFSLMTASQAIAGASPAEIQAVINRRADMFGDTSVEVLQAKEAAKAAAIRMNQDSFSYVMEDPALAAAYRKASESEDPEDLQAVLTMASDRQVRFGAAPRVMTVRDATAQAQRLRDMAAGIPVKTSNGVSVKASTDQVVAEIDAITDRYGPLASQAIADLTALPDQGKAETAQRIGLPTELRIVAALPPSQGALRAQIVQNLNWEDADIKTPNDGSANKIREAIAGNRGFQEFRASLFASSPDDGRQDIMDWGEAVERQAQRLLYTGQVKSENAAVDQAVKVMVGSVWKIKDGLRIPLSRTDGAARDADAIPAALLKIQTSLAGDIDWSSLMPPAVIGMDEGRSRLLAQKQGAPQLAWINTSDGAGAQLVRRNNSGNITPVRLTSGRAVAVDFDKLDGAKTTTTVKHTYSGYPFSVDEAQLPAAAESLLRDSGSGNDTLRDNVPGLFSPDVHDASGTSIKKATLSDRGKQQIADKIAAAAISAGLPPDAVIAMVAQESDFNANLGMASSSARGLFQLLKNDRRKFNISETASIDDQIRAGIEKTKENFAAAQKALGRDPTAGELYVIHYQGIGAGPAILKDPSANFRATLNGIKAGWAEKVIKANPWLGKIETNADFIRWSEAKMNAQKKRVGV